MRTKPDLILVLSGRCFKNIFEIISQRIIFFLENYQFFSKPTEKSTTFAKTLSFQESSLSTEKLSKREGFLFLSKILVFRKRALCMQEHFVIITIIYIASSIIIIAYFYLLLSFSCIYFTLHSFSRFSLFTFQPSYIFYFPGE